MGIGYIISEEEKRWASAPLALGAIFGFGMDKLIQGGFGIAIGGVGFLLGPLAVYLLQKQSRFLRFHSLQTFFLILLALSILSVSAELVKAIVRSGLEEATLGPGLLISGVGVLLLFFIPLLLSAPFLLATLYASHKVRCGEWHRLPMIGKIAEGLAS